MIARTGTLVAVIFFSLFTLTGCGEKEAKNELPTFDTADLQTGRSVWMQVCRNCHLVGVAGAPAISDYAAWETRLSKGADALYARAIAGIESGSGWSMPPRGGNDSLSDAEVRQAVDYTIAAIESLRQD